MQKHYLVLITSILLCACNGNTEKASETNMDIYPQDFTEVLKAHGGLDKWKKAKTLSFKKDKETYTIDLNSRKALIKTPKYSLGYDGKTAWLKEKDTAAFKGNVDFYHNLFFYFFAMPFVLADSGIVYSETQPITVEGKTYPGIKIAYQDGVGASSKDNYYLYYNAKTHKMEWLAYTVTYFDQKEKGKEQANIIKYSDWQAIGGVKLPKTIIWYAKDSLGNIVAPKDPKPVTFSKVSLSAVPVNPSIFNKE
ncbi:DUF6503 family protein [Galbibacter sp. PAP.153]|uniref:DUF6503 family protein n=1 Tax=Galbibacter sp. PAP.153 TaxID=3104623 RepID=UPI00300A055C